MGMAIGGIYPKVAHGEALAVIYPEVTRFTYAAAIEKYSTLGRIINPALESESDEAAAEKSCQELDNFLKEIGMYFGLCDFGIPEDELDALADQCMVLPDYENNPKVPNLQDVRQMLQDAYSRS
jgi:alcohol dehydrogenase class IV